ncbi:hypothetical protein [Mycobacterium shigaense]|uniref:Uncharacterized protein n=1 Tax=Mycobacterium shigaense TaxID=722731 RepID=A0A1Z4EGJ5_9MYCO|nr:hypothetical protein [Mycobacterium shigaense]PRI16738.1 hypothetical protein B2J96_03545 [Mycobacterium shigaense]BAX92046.1 hypothetical protein MSG_01893 [Mycobacterium shigaense]
MSEDVQPDAATDRQVSQDETPDDTAGATNAASDDADQFPRDYVERLRKESAGYRDKAKTAEGRSDELARQLFAARVAATGLLADPRDLPFDANWLDSETELRGAIAALLDDKPHLKARNVTGDIGQGRRGEAAAKVNLIGLLRGER